MLFISLLLFVVVVAMAGFLFGVVVVFFFKLFKEDNKRDDTHTHIDGRQRRLSGDLQLFFGVCYSEYNVVYIHTHTHQNLNVKHVCHGYINSAIHNYIPIHI